MNPTKYFTRVIVLASLFAFAASGLKAQDEEKTVAGYLFFSLDVSAESGKSHFPVVAVDKKNIWVDNGKKVKKTSSLAHCQVQTDLKLSESYAEVLDMDFKTSSLRNTHRSARAISDSRAIQMDSEAAINFINTEVGDPDGGSATGGSPSDSKEARIANITSTSENIQSAMQEGYDDQTFEVAEAADTIQVVGTLLPGTNVKEAYGVVMVTYELEDRKPGKDVARGILAGAVHIGDLKKDEVAKIRLRVVVGEFNKKTAKFNLYIFSKGGEPVALSNSQGLKSLTSKQVSTYKELVRNAAAKSGS